MYHSTQFLGEQKYTTKTAGETNSLVQLLQARNMYPNMKYFQDLSVPILLLI